MNDKYLTAALIGFLAGGVIAGGWYLAMLWYRARASREAVRETLGMLAIASLLVVCDAGQAFDLSTPWKLVGEPLTGTGACRSQVGFSPEGSASRLVGDALDGATRQVHLAAYTFTSPDIARRLIAAKRRGVDVAVIADEKENLRGRGSRAGQAALNLLVEADIPVRTISAYVIHHDKYIVIDGDTVETGSYNYSAAAARRNSENALVIAHCPALASAYEAHWQSRWAQGDPYKASY